MKLLMTTDTLGGVWTYCMELCAALAPYETEIALATMGRALSPEQRWQVKRLPHVHLHESTYRLCWMQDSEQDVKDAGDWLLQLEEEFEPDVVQLNDLAHGGLAWRSPVMLVGHSCVFSWWEAVCKQLPPQDEWAEYHKMVSRSVQSATTVVAPSHAMLNALLRHYGPANNSAVIYNGRDFPTLVKPEQVKKVPDTRKSEGLIFAAGRIWDPAKNIGVLSQIVHQLPWTVYTAGEQTDPNGGSNIPEDLNCLGFLNSDEMAQWLNRAAIYVAPAHYEPFGLSILEAARAGCALVVGNIESLLEVWGDAAEYVNPDDPEEICRILTDLAKNPARRQQLAEKAWQQAKRYTASQMAADYMKTYRRMLARDEERARSGKPISGVSA